MFFLCKNPILMSMSIWKFQFDLQRNTWFSWRLIDPDFIIFILAQHLNLMIQDSWNSDSGVIFFESSPNRTLLLIGLMARIIHR